MKREEQIMNQQKRAIEDVTFLQWQKSVQVTVIAVIAFFKPRALHLLYKIYCFMCLKQVGIILTRPHSSTDDYIVSAVNNFKDEIVEILETVIKVICSEITANNSLNLLLSFLELFLFKISIL